MNNVVTIVYYIALAFMFYKIFIIVRYVLKTNENFRIAQKLNETSQEINAVDKANDVSKPEYDIQFIRKNGKFAIAALVIAMVTIFINGFAL